MWRFCHCSACSQEIFLTLVIIVLHQDCVRLQTSLPSNSCIENPVGTEQVIEIEFEFLRMQ